MAQTRLGIAGLGSIGRTIARNVHTGAIPGIVLAGVSTGNSDKALAFLKEIGCAAPVLSIGELAAASDLVIECAPASAFPEIAYPVLSAGKRLMVLSAGQLLSHPDLIELAQRNSASIIVPTGALIGLDAVIAAAEGKINAVSMITRKPVKGLMGAPYLAQHGIEIAGIIEPLRIFRGTAREAALGFPENVNVVAALSLAGIGPDRTTIEIWADPTLSRNVHRVMVDADSARFEMTIENIPSENPKTGRITALSALAALRKLHAPLRVGT